MRTMAIVFCLLLAGPAQAATSQLAPNVYYVTEGVEFQLGNNGASDYLFSWSDSGGSYSDIVDPTIILRAGQTYTFRRVTSAHPFVITDTSLPVSGADGNFSRSTFDGAVIDNATLSPIADFTADPAPTTDAIVWTPGAGDVGDYYYTCRVTSHPGMTGALQVSPAPTGTADVQIIHNSPDPAAETVNIYVNGVLSVQGLAFREATPVVALESGIDLLIGIAPGPNSTIGDILATFVFNLEANEAYAVIATGTISSGLPTNPDGVPVDFELLAQPGLRTSSAGSVALLANHGSPNAPQVDVRARGVGPLFEGLFFKDFSPGYLEVPAADYVLDITPAGNPSSIVASFTAPLSGLAGGAAVVFASGYLSDTPSFGLFAALPDGSVIELPPNTSVSTEQQNWGRLKSSYVD